MALLLKLTATDLIQLGSLIVAAVGLCYLVKYVAYTRKIAEQAVAQTEASFKPAVAAVYVRSDSTLSLRNIGKGPALDVEWTITGTNKHARIPHIEAGNSFPLPVPVPDKRLAEGALKSDKNAVAITCSYRSIAGRRYRSLSDYDFDSSQFSTTFEDLGET